MGAKTHRTHSRRKRHQGNAAKPSQQTVSAPDYSDDDVTPEAIEKLRVDAEPTPSGTDDGHVRCPICNAPFDMHLMFGEQCVLIGDEEPSPSAPAKRALRADLSLRQGHADDLENGD
jgi:hypothetical protein